MVGEEKGGSLDDKHKDCEGAAGLPGRTRTNGLDCNGYATIDKLVTGFYDGRTELHWDIDWFLSFELWRRGNKLT